MKRFFLKLTHKNGSHSYDLIYATDKKTASDVVEGVFYKLVKQGFVSAEFVGEMEFLTNYIAKQGVNRVGFLPN